MSTWAAIVLSSITTLGFMLVGYVKISARLSALEILGAIKASPQTVQAGEDRRQIEMDNHCKNCPAMLEHRQDNSKVRPNPLATPLQTAL